jgi:protein-tyrosine phosphatase
VSSGSSAFLVSEREEEESVSDRVLAWEGCRNVRDLGGYGTLDGQTRWGALVRADSLGQLTPAGRDSVIQYGIRTIVDVRFPVEVAREPDPFVGGHGGANAPAYLNIPVSSGRDPSMEAAIAEAFAGAISREEAIRVELYANPIGYARIIGAVAAARAGGVVVHCQHGNGRTGIVVALMLAAIGVADEEVASDYSLSARSLDETYARWLETQTDVDAVEAEAVHRQAIADPHAMLGMLSHLQERYGGAEEYLRSAGLGRAEMDGLRERLVEPSS